MNCSFFCFNFLKFRAFWRHDCILNIQLKQFIQLPKNNIQTLQIDLQDISDKVFQEEEELLFGLNQWAFKKKFKLILSEGKKPTKDGYRQVIGCSNKKCNFKLTFKSFGESQEFTMDLTLSNKWNNHNGFFYFTIK